MATLYYLKDSSNQVWVLGADDLGRIETTVVTGIIASTSILLKDAATAQVWSLTILPDGQLQLTASSGNGLSSLPCISLSGYVWDIQVANGQLQTVVDSYPYTLGMMVRALAERLYDTNDSFSLLFLADGAGNLWRVGVNNIGEIQATPTSNVPVSTLSLTDTVTGTVWAITILASGQLNAQVTAGAGVSGLTCIAPNGSPWTIQMVNGSLESSPAASATTSMIHWTQAELIAYIQETLRTWNAFTGYWRGDFTFQTVAGDVWYDLTDTADLPNTLRPLTITDQYTLQLIEWHLLEPLTTTYPLTWTGTTQFSIGALLAALERARDETLGATCCTISRETVPAAHGRIFLSDTVIDIRRNVYIDSNGTVNYLWKSDPQAWLGYFMGYTTAPAGVPQTYSTSTEPVFSFDVDVPPVLPGTYELLTVNTGPTLTTSNSSPIIVPDDWYWVVKWRAIADLLGQANEPSDPMRQKYCEVRYEQGIKLLALAPAVLAARVNNIPVFIDSVKSADAYQVGWEGAPESMPTVVLSAGLNLVALSPPADGVYSVSLTVVKNAPVPVNLYDAIDMSVDLIDVMLDYAEHLAMFKEGGAEFTATVPLYDRFMTQAQVYSSKLGMQGPFQRELFAMSQKEEVMEPRMKEEETVG